MFAHLFGYQATDDLSSKPATELMPSLVIPSLNDNEVFIVLCVAYTMFLMCGKALMHTYVHCLSALL